MGVKRFLRWTFFSENVRKSDIGSTICVTLPKVAEVNKASIATVAGDFAIFLLSEP